MPEKIITFRVTGRVQGVAFRAWARDTAQALGLDGWVRNAADGAVTGMLSGDREAVEAMVAALGRGPRLARVDRVETAAAAGPGVHGFKIRR